MGCDIHFYVETKGQDGVWKTADKWGHSEWDEPGDPLRVNYEDAFYRGRSYNLFAILADVRNGRGFAGCDTGDGFKPIAPPRGVPEDAGPLYKKTVESWDADGHSHSYFTVAELLAYDWTQETRHRGWVDIENWAHWRSQGKPESWSGMVSGGRVRHVTPADMASAWIKLRQENDWPEQRWPSVHLCRRDDESKANFARMTELLGGGSIYTQVQWTEPYYKSVGSFWSETMPRLFALGKPEDVRICFFFDN